MPSTIQPFFLISSDYFYYWSFTTYEINWMNTFPWRFFKFYKYPPCYFFIQLLFHSHITREKKIQIKDHSRAVNKIFTTRQLNIAVVTYVVTEVTAIYALVECLLSTKEIIYVRFIGVHRFKNHQSYINTLSIFFMYLFFHVITFLHSAHFAYLILVKLLKFDWAHEDMRYGGRGFPFIYDLLCSIKNAISFQ